jgi:adenylate cyclase class 2
MRYEVEQKHRIADVASFVARLSERGVTLGSAVIQSDRYFAHPCRDFTETDEALRIRTVGGFSFVTYKGPKLDSTTKTRQELELPLDRGDADGAQFSGLLSALGFTPVAIVRKQRRRFEMNFAGRAIEGALDVVEGVGTFVELETLADDAEVEAAQYAIRALADELELVPAERRSYLELLLENCRSRK